MEKLDLKKEYKTAFSAKKKPEIISIPKMQYITFSGKGDPGTSKDFEEAMGVLYGLAYTVKFMYKEKEMDFVVAPLEGQWWSDNVEVFAQNKRDEWLWKVMIALPEYVTAADFETAREKLEKKKNPLQLEKAKLETMEDGLAVQVLYIGSYSEEAATIAAMHHFAEEQGYRLRSRHREVYLSNPQRTSPDKLKTIIRHPLEKVEC
jgi:hypothetical protein